MKKGSLLYTAVAGAVIVVLIVTAATVWMSSGARNATDKAVERVSGFYLEELAGRRSQVVSRFFETTGAQLERAISLAEPEDLASVESLRAFIGKTEALYGLNLFAVVDEENVVYTKYTTYTGGSRYAFLSGEPLAGPVITTAATYGGGKEICLAVPVADRSFMGRKLKVCFAQISMEDVVSVLAFNTEENGTRFSLYYANGENLTGHDFGPVGARQNLLDEMKRWLSEEDSRTLAERFAGGAAGEALFSVSGSEEILYYSPVPGTQWMITVLIYKDLIQDQVSGIRDETVTRSMVQILVTCASLLAFFGILALQARGKSRALLEAERKIAVRDALTGVGNKYAYTRKEEEVNLEIRNGAPVPFAVVVCDLNGLKQANDTLGHAAGDELIRKACALLCKLYAHSPVYRIGGDEFAVFLRGSDYENRADLLASLDRQAEENTGSGEPVVAAGMAEYSPGDRKLHDTFERADQRMYERKKQLKSALPGQGALR